MEIESYLNEKRKLYEILRMLNLISENAFIELIETIQSKKLNQENVLLDSNIYLQFH